MRPDVDFGYHSSSPRISKRRYYATLTVAKRCAARASHFVMSDDDFCIDPYTPDELPVYKQESEVQSFAEQEDASFLNDRPYEQQYDFNVVLANQPRNNNHGQFAGVNHNGVAPIYSPFPSYVASGANVLGGHPPNLGYGLQPGGFPVAPQHEPTRKEANASANRTVQNPFSEKRFCAAAESLELLSAFSFSVPIRC